MKGVIIVEMHKANKISENVRVLKPVFSGDNKTEIVTSEGTYYSPKTPIQLLQSTCVDYMSSYRGRVEAVRETTGFKYKTPLYIGGEDFSAFPTTSADRPDCEWVFQTNFKIMPKNKKEVTLIYEDGQMIDVKASKHTIEKQLMRTTYVINYANRKTKK